MAGALTLGALACGGLEPVPGGAFSGGGFSAGTTFIDGVAGSSTGGSSYGPLPDDGIDCTLDKCDGNSCTHIPRHFRCGPAQFCSTVAGCVETQPCSSDATCQTLDGCVVGTCNLATSRCNFTQVDDDSDGEFPIACGGEDCDDDDSSLKKTGPDICDGLDNDCDGVVDPPSTAGCAAPLVCSAGQCGCPEPLGTCPGLDGCLDFTSNPRACGGCGQQCLPSSACAASSCDAEVQLVKMYGGANAVPSAARLVTDASGNFYAALSTSGEHRALPDGPLPLWSANEALVKLDSNADFVWAVPTNFPILAQATSGSDVWIVVAGDATVQVGESSFALADEHLALGLVLKLSGASGAILDVQRFDFVAQVPESALLVVDVDGAWSAFNDGGTVDYMNTTSAPPSVAYSAVLYHVGTAEPRWLPGTLRNLAFDDDGKLVVSDDVLGAFYSFSFGGDTFTTGPLDRTAIARYSKALAHEASFVLPSEKLEVCTGMPLGPNVLCVGAKSAYLQTYDFTGKLLLSADQQWPLKQLSPQVIGGEVVGYGYTNDQAQKVGNRDFAQNSSYFVKLHSQTGQIDEAFSIASKLSNGIVTRISGYALDPTNHSAMVAMFFDGTLDIGGTTYGQDGNRGVAFVKMKLRTP